MAVASDKTRVNVQIPRDLKAKAEKVAQIENRSLSNLMVTLLKGYVDRYGDLNEKLKDDECENRPKQRENRPKQREVRVIEGVECLQCSKCKEWKEFNGFAKGGGKYKDGTQKYMSYCKECEKERKKEWREISIQKSLDHTKKIFSQNGLINDKLKDKGLYGVIYLFQNKINKRCYVGQTTVGLENRYSEDVIEGWIKDRKNCESTLLEEDIEKYGTEVFTCDIIDIGYCRFHLDKLEAYYIDKYKAFEEGYNNYRGNLITSDGIREFKELIKEYGLEELVSKEAIEFFEKNLEEEIVCCF